MGTMEALALLDNEGVAQVWFDSSSLNIQGTEFNLFYCTFDGKFAVIICRQNEAGETRTNDQSLLQGNWVALRGQRAHHRGAGNQDAVVIAQL